MNISDKYNSIEIRITAKTEVRMGQNNETNINFKKIFRVYFTLFFKILGAHVYTCCQVTTLIGNNVALWPV
jgi:hypothetical protein